MSLKAIVLNVKFYFLSGDRANSQILGGDNLVQGKTLAQWLDLLIQEYVSFGRTGHT